MSLLLPTGRLYVFTHGQGENYPAYRSTSLAHFVDFFFLCDSAGGTARLKFISLVWASVIYAGDALLLDNRRRAGPERENENSAAWGKWSRLWTGKRSRQLNSVWLGTDTRVK
jgi:hypothetical protein